MDPLRHLPGIKDRLQVGRRLVGGMPCTPQTDSRGPATAWAWQSGGRQSPPVLRASRPSSWC